MNPSLPASRRGGLVAVLAAVAVATALAAGLIATGGTSAAHAHRGHDHGQVLRGPTTKAQVAFHDQMRKLWEDHVTWTRLAIVTFADGSPGFPATAARLMRNQEDIGAAIKPFYGEAAGDRLTALLKDHIAIAVRLLQAAKTGDDAALRKARKTWYANADDIAGFLARANPRSWPRDAMHRAMRAHLDQTLTEAAHELSGDYAKSVADYEMVHHHILGMADVLSDGIVRAFPRRFR